MELVSGNILIRPMEFAAAGDVMEGHTHNFDHTTYVVRGAVRIDAWKLRDDVVREVARAVTDGVPEFSGRFLDAAGQPISEEDAYVPLRTVEKRASDGHNWVLIKAENKHRITALEDNSLAHCIYAHRNPQGEVVQDYDGWMPGYV